MKTIAMKTIRRIPVFLLMLLLVQGLYGQSALPVTSGQQKAFNPSSLWLEPDTTDFITIQQQVEAYYANRDKGRGSGYKQWKRWEYKMRHRLTNDGQIQNYAASNWQGYYDYFSNQNNISGPESTHGQWDPLGITYSSTTTGWNGGIGRVNCIAFHPTNANIIYIGTPAGGLWKTSNGGGTWTPLTDGMPTIGVSGIAIDYTNTNVIYILTGDGDGGDVLSQGVMKSVNGGMTWMTTGLVWTLADDARPFKLLMHPTKHNTLFVVSTEGIHKTTDGGVSWTQVKAGFFFDIEFKPNSSNIVYTVKNSEFHKSTDTGNTWTKIIDPNLPTNAFRLAIGVSPANANYVYLHSGPAWVNGGVYYFKGVYLSTNSGDGWALRSNTPNILGYDQGGQDTDEQTTYDLAIAISRTDISDVMAGGINVWTSSNWGSSWAISSWWDTRGNTIGYTHADIHALEINPLNNYVYCGSDGGIYRSTDFGNSWADISSGLEITQWYRIDGVESNINLLAGGTQDNGSNFWTGGSFITHVRGADGMDAMVSNSNTNIRYTTRQYGVLEKTIDAGANWTLILNSGGPWVTPLVMDPTDDLTFYVGLSNIRKTTTGGTGVPAWTSLGVDGRDALAMGTNNTNRIYAARTTTLKMSNDAGTSWTTVSAGLPAGRNITGICVNPDYSLDVWVTLDGFAAGQKVYRSTDAGTTWTNVSGTLPNVSVNCIAYADHNGSPNDALYLGTDVGMFYRDDNTGDWIPFSNGLPVVPVFDIEIYESNSLVYAATHGRGIWKSSLYTSCPTGYVLNPTNDPSIPNYTGIQNYEASSYINSSRVITGGVGTDVTYQAGSYLNLTDGFVARENNLFVARLGPCGATAPLAPLPPPIPVTGKYAGSIVPQLPAGALPLSSPGMSP